MENTSINFRTIGKAVITALIITLILFIILATILYMTNISDTIVPTAVFIISIFSLIIGGIFSTKNAEKSGFLHGALTALGYFIVILIGSFIVNDGFVFNAGMLTTLIALSASGMLGGIIGINSKSKKRKYR